VTYAGSLRNGCGEALLAHLLHRNIEEFDVFAVPNTGELIKQKLQALRGVMKWVYDAVYSGELIGTTRPQRSRQQRRPVRSTNCGRTANGPQRFSTCRPMTHKRGRRDKRKGLNPLQFLQWGQRVDR
jgi:hypothetical protein